MLIKVLLRRNELVETVHKREVDDFATARAVQIGVCTVHAVADGPVRIESFGEERLTVLEGGTFSPPQTWQTNCPALRDARNFPRVPATTQFVFEETVDTVKRAPGSAARDEQVRTPGSDQKLFWPKYGVE